AGHTGLRIDLEQLITKLCVLLHAINLAISRVICEVTFVYAAEAEGAHNRSLAGCRVNSKQHRRRNRITGITEPVQRAIRQHRQARKCKRLRRQLPPVCNGSGFRAYIKKLRRPKTATKKHALPVKRDAIQHGSCENPSPKSPKRSHLSP